MLVFHMILHIDIIVDENGFYIPMFLNFDMPMNYLVIL